MPRTENDTWDLASGVGATATGVAASRALASRVPDPLISDPFAQPLVNAVGVDYYVRLAEGRLDTDDADALDPQVIADGMAIRTRYFDDFLLTAVDAGIRQAVILASGLDARAYRLSWPDGMTVFELDQPAVVEFKTRTLADLGATPTADLHTIGVDLRRDWPAALRARGFDPQAPTAWIAEGLLGYLPPDAQDRLFDNITALSAPGSRIATDWVAEQAQLDNDRVRALADHQRDQGMELDDLSDLIFTGERNAVAQYLTDSGWLPETTTAERMFAIHGVPFRRDDAVAGLVDANYTAATLTVAPA
ncbi:class I SAM-dependent methyltransferase [Mycolicibacterium brisbanense]|uniref:S-adenosyl-L-methionine-dependent methyltransferase n=1 Tax=Mycolicibacterium brisbanense TaxID=146020 RepID=A0A100VV38_9MYCO|nr:class I SAM-dependent methyltransferase [Mycolicibacterium brisbanense]MCV7156690.1 class I SAM-dependent methyltransferase [Mycolicibacterium brisbanense]GAS86588.1 putative S-adenosyl-L-methionine-dependentmethyl transferase [Mycolicibacterium brisbanense]